METKTFTTIDRSALEWPSGPWDGEPDKMQWPDDATGLPCLAVRNRRHGNWCGYVGLPPGHAVHGKDYQNAPYFDVHGGLTFAGPCSPGEDEARGICHTPAPGEPDHVWWLGFDCAHSGDASPYNYVMERRHGGCWAVSGDTYRTLAYVRRECAELAAQIAAHSDPA